MTQRKKRLSRLCEHRQHQLDLKVGKLSEMRLVEQKAGVQVEQERREYERAERERSEAVSRPVAVGHFADANVFLQSCAKRCELAEQALARALKAVHKAQIDVVAAKNDLRKIQLLTERLAKEDQASAARVEQRLGDEFAARRAADTQKRRSEP